MTKGIGRPGPYLGVVIAQRLAQRGRQGLVPPGQENVLRAIRRGRAAHVGVGVEQGVEEGVAGALVLGDVVGDAGHDALAGQRVGVVQAGNGLGGGMMGLR